MAINFNFGFEIKNFLRQIQTKSISPYSLGKYGIEQSHNGSLTIKF